MPWVTNDQLERARRVSILDYILIHESSNARRVGSGYRLKDHPSLAISNNGWYWHSHDIGGKTAVDYLTEVRGYSLVDAVCTVLNESPQRGANHTNNRKTAGKTSKNREPTLLKPNTLESAPEITQISLPLRNKDDKRVIAYLQSRGIDRDLIMACIEQGSLYESRYHHNAIFIGRDERGKPRYATIRSTTSNFMRDANGSDKKYGVLLPPSNPGTNEVAVFESPIDALSHQTLCNQGHIQPFDGWRLSLGGTSTLALEHFIKHHPEITHCRVCTDNDKSGEMAMERIAAMSCVSSGRSPPTVGKDWNDSLQMTRKVTQTKGQQRLSDARSL